MRLPNIAALIGLGLMSIMLSGCGEDFNTGFGELPGWGGYTRQYGDVDVGLDKPVGLCSYTGGCMPDDNGQSTSVNSYKGTGSVDHTDHSSVDHDSGQ